MVDNISTDEGAQIHVAATFGERTVGQYSHQDLKEYVETLLDDENILYSSVICVETGESKLTVQCKLHKAAISMMAIDDIVAIFEAIQGHKDSWILTESVMQHPEIYK